MVVSVAIIEISELWNVQIFNGLSPQIINEVFQVKPLAPSNTPRNKRKFLVKFPKQRHIVLRQSRFLFLKSVVNLL